MKLYKRALLINQLKGMTVLLGKISKEIASMDVPGLELVREDLEPKEEKKTVHGQKQNQPVSSNRVTKPAGMGVVSDVPNLGSDYPSWTSGPQ